MDNYCGNWQYRSSYDIKILEASHFPLLKNAWKQMCFVGKENKIAFKCLGKAGHLKKNKQNTEQITLIA